jgi:hypothetical protein
MDADTRLAVTELLSKTSVTFMPDLAPAPGWGIE